LNELLGTLETICGPGGVLTGEQVSSRSAGIWNPENMEALAIVRPRDTSEVSAVLELCNRHGQSVVPHGGLTGLVHGTQSDGGDIVLSLERMTGIEGVDPVNRTMTVQSGVVLENIHTAAESVGLQFTLDLGARGSCTIGGNVATNAGGNQVIRYGMARDQVLGLEAVLADGTVLSSMNQMIKNNAGYDLKQLFMGTEGTLGVITRLVLRLRELPQSQNTALVASSSLDRVSGLLKHVDAGLGGQLSGFEVMWNDFYKLVTTPPSDLTPPLDQGHDYYVLIEALGSNQASDREQFEAVLGAAMEAGLVDDAVVARSGRERASLWAIRDDVERTYDHGPPITFDVSLRIPDMQDYVETVRQRLAGEWGKHHFWVFGHLGDGNLHLVVSVGDDKGETRHRVEAAVYEPLAELGGSVSAEHGIGLEKKSWLKLSRSEDEIEVMRRLKQALDPRGILNPGKVFDSR
jgi:FAD/FMN-containing dehydrogenase